MKLSIKLLTIVALPFLISCNQGESDGKQKDAEGAEAVSTEGQGSMQSDPGSSKDVVNVALNSPDHTTLVAALKQAELVASLSNVGPFTVFAPTNEAFDKLPKGTVDGLMKDESKEDLQNILQYHVFVASLKPESFEDGQTLGMVNGDNVTISVKDGVVKLNNSATIVSAIPASNGMVYVIDGVLLPSKK